MSETSRRDSRHSQTNALRQRISSLEAQAAGLDLAQVMTRNFGGEWFAMWQSPTWNGQQAAFRFYVAVLGAGIFVALDDPDLQRKAA